MSNANNILHQKFQAAFKKANITQKSASSCQVEANKVWNDLKLLHADNKGEEFLSKVNEQIGLWEAKALHNRAGLLNFWAKASTAKPTTGRDIPSSENEIKIMNGPHQADVSVSKSSKPAESASIKRKYSTPAQDQLRKEISVAESELNALYKRRDCGILAQSSDITAEIKTATQNLEKKKLSLKKKVSATNRGQKWRDCRKRDRQDLIAENPAIAQRLHVREGVGRPSLEDTQPELLKTLAEIAISGGSADARRRSEVIRSCRTLDDLTAELKSVGFSVSHSSVYLQVIPRCWETSVGKRHVNTVPVRLKRPEADHHQKHPDGLFCKASINQLEELASLLGPDSVLFISQDDKARVALGLPAAKKQAPIVMHMDYRVSLPDHDWVVAQRHKLIPSVYAGIEISRNKLGDKKAVGYSGPTYIAIRSGKHDSSTAETHCRDLQHLFTLDDFKPLVKTPSGHVKPVLIITIDGGPDENPRYHKVITVAMNHFKNYNLDALFLATNAPGRSAFNRVERRMAPLSHDLAGLILPHDHFGTHLNNQKQTIDVELEKKNFAHAGKVLAEVWSGTTINGFNVHAEYVEPGDCSLPAEPDQKWKTRHVRESQYFLQILRCEDRTCCGPWRSKLPSVLKERFMANPVPLQQDVDQGLLVPTPAQGITSFSSLFINMVVGASMQSSVACNYKVPPYDLFCPSVQNQLIRRVCSTCGIYHASIKSKTAHEKCCSSSTTASTSVSQPVRIRPLRIAARRQREMLVIIRDELNGEDAEWLDEDDVDYSHCLQATSSGGLSMPVYPMDDVLSSPWEPVTN